MHDVELVFSFRFHLRFRGSGEKLFGCGEKLLECGEKSPESGEKRPASGEKLNDCGELSKVVRNFLVAKLIGKLPAEGQLSGSGFRNHEN